MVDLGCGTGVLSLVMSENGGFNGQIYSIDSQERCIQSTEMNSQIFGLADRQHAIQLDIVDFYHMDDSTQDSVERTAFYKNTADELGIPFTVDLIICNPPWIPAKFVQETNPLDNGVYDPEEKFLKSALNFAKVHLDKNTGEMLLIHSDLAYQLGLQESTRVGDLATQYGLRAELIDKT